MGIEHRLELAVEAFTDPEKSVALTNARIYLRTCWFLHESETVKGSSANRVQIWE